MPQSTKPRPNGDPLMNPRAGDRVRVGCNVDCFREVNSRAGGWVHFDFWDGERWSGGGTMRLKAWRGVCVEFGQVVRCQQS